MDKRFIEQCELEQLHLSGQIQAHGALFVVDAEFCLTHISANLYQFLPTLEGMAIGGALPEVFARLAHELDFEVGSRLRRESIFHGPQGVIDVVLARNAERSVIFEFTLHLDTNGAGGQEGVLGIDPARDEDDLAQRQQDLITRIFAQTGFQRVLYYRFREDGDGEVLHESRCPEIYGSYLGLRFPASDIPQIARVLYMMNPWRMIPDVSALPVPVYGALSSSPDLSYSDLRSVSPIHVLYLQNMGVGASLSFPLVVGGELWGLIACHHTAARYLPLDVLNRLSQDIRTHALSLSAYFAQRRILLLEGLVRRFSEAHEILHGAGTIMHAWPRLGEWLADEFAADGAVLCLGDEQAVWGEALEAETLHVVDQWFLARSTEPVWYGEHLSRQIPDMPLSQVAGLLAVKVKLAGGMHLRIYLCRQEYIHEVFWGGNPDKPVEYHDGKFGIAPRRSFGKWVEKRLGHSRPWENESRLLALKLRELLAQVGPHV